jgi:hypothetical protein
MIRFGRMHFNELIDATSGSIIQNVPFEYYRIRDQVSIPIVVLLVPIGNSVYNAVCGELYV